MIGRWLGRLGSPPKLIVTVPSSPAWAVTLLTDLRDVDAEGADRADRDRPGDLLQVRGDRIEGAAQLVVVQHERGDAQDLRDRPVAGPVPDVHQRRGRGEPVADHRLDGLTD